MTIDPLEAVIIWLRTALTDLDGRVAHKHEYGEHWTESETGLAVHMDGGNPDLYARVATPRLEMRIYADDSEKIVNVWSELTRLSRDNARFAINTSKGTALIHYVKPETNLSLIYDEVVRMDLGIVFMKSMISEEAISA
jgi:hypothetical protein